MKNPMVGLLCAFVLACVVAPLSFAQTGLGAITGHVTDPQGKLIAGRRALRDHEDPLLLHRRGLGDGIVVEDGDEEPPS